MSDEGYEQQFVKEAFDTNWIAPLGENVNKFEEEIAKYAHAKNAAALISGTAAIHLAVKLAGVQQGDIVLCQDLTFAASAYPIMYEKGTLVFVDSEKDTWNMDPQALRKALAKYPEAKAVIAVHLYGIAAKIDEIKAICDEYQVPLIEDAAESLGTKYHDQMTGTFGDYGIYSFNGNKIITTSGGGMLISNDDEAIKKARYLSTQSRQPVLHYQHTEIGYNYRLSNISAGIGRGQMRVLEDRVAKKRQIHEAYKEGFKDIDDIKVLDEGEDERANFWLSAIQISPDSPVQPLTIHDALEKENIETRPVWKPMSLQPLFKDYDYIGEGISHELYEHGLCLPSDTKMTKEDIQRTIQVIRSLWEK